MFWCKSHTECLRQVCFLAVCLLPFEAMQVRRSLEKHNDATKTKAHTLSLPKAERQKPEQIVVLCLVELSAHSIGVQVVRIEFILLAAGHEAVRVESRRLLPDI